MALESFIPKAQRTFLFTQFDRITQPISDFIRSNPIVSTVSLGTVGVGAVAAITGVVRKKKKAKRKVPKKRKTRRKTTKRKVSKRKGKKWYGKTKTRKIKHTKNGQPYVILKSGKARFIKKSRSRSMKKRKGGYS